MKVCESVRVPVDGTIREPLTKDEPIYSIKRGAPDEKTNKKGRGDDDERMVVVVGLVA